jgi:MoaA/NifB/PqqE/SkfB family radical SAM enzyme
MDKPNPSLTPKQLLSSWGKILRGHIPMLSIEITRECPLSCPGCYAFGESHLGGGVTLRELNDSRGDELVNGILGLVEKHNPIQVSLVGGEPMMRHRELSRILPVLSAMDVFTMVVTSGVIPIPQEWMAIPRMRVAISVDGLAPDHDVRRKPATYERILRNIDGRTVNIHWVITGPMMRRPGYLDEYVAFWNSRPEVDRIWVSLYTPQIGEQSIEMLTPEDRAQIAAELPPLAKRYPKLLMNQGIADAFVNAPKSPADCVFSKMSVNYSADLKSRVEPCVFGGSPDCTQCGCAISSGLHWLRGVRVAGPLKIDHFIRGSMKIGRIANKLRNDSSSHPRWEMNSSEAEEAADLVQIQR